MIALIIKTILFLSSFGYTIFLFTDGDWIEGILMLFVPALVVLTIFKNEWIILSLLQMRNQNTEKAAKYLAKIKQPQFLIKRQRAYFYYMTALANRESYSISESEKLFKKALATGLKQAQDKAIAKLNLAAFAMSKGRRKEADVLLIEVKKLDTGKVLTDHVKDLRKQMGRSTSTNQMRMAQMGRGKRR